MDLNLKGKRALITGGSRGIGLGVATQLAAEGVNLVLVARDENRLGKVRELLHTRYSVDVTIVAADLYDPNTPARLAEPFADIDILVNNANTPSGGSLEGLSEEQWLHNWSLKPFGYIRMLRAFIPKLRARGRGVIVNMIGQINQVATNKALYSSASCAALSTITKALAHELAAHNIRICGVGAWVVNTETVIEGYRAKAASKLGDPARWRELMAHLPFGRAAQPQEVGDLVAFLVSDRAAYLSGQVIDLDGGYIGSTVPTLASGALAHE
jgi:3-oxoacyl-[acyl-carrier protein] reductase